jgi:hypothetical protein
MPTWTLIVVADQEYRIPVGKDESVALEKLTEARHFIGRNGVVTIADRLALEARSIKSVRIEEKADPGGPILA